jgi:A/G-specific adenine glycosylase
MNFANALTGWYLRHKRDLPWRETRDPYRIWLSEIMLQQTRVAQGLPYYIAFTDAFPTVSDLAQSSEQTVLKLWQGMGYYSRARNLHATARHVAGNLGGKFPDSYRELRKLKGVGDYTAAAIASFSYGEAVPVVDGNVMRVLSRYFGIETDIGKPTAKKEFAALGLELMPKNDAATFNQAIMEFGALQCVPKRPDCGVCPLNASCVALQTKVVDKLPVKSKKAPSRHRHLNYIIFDDAKGRTLIRKRTAGIWRSLYEFPLVETDAAVEASDILRALERKDIASILEIDGEGVVHKLTHQTLHIRFWKATVETALENALPPDEIRVFPFPIVLFNFIERNWK